MAGDTHEVDLGADLDLPPWPTVVEIAGAVPVDDWALVGGLMVRLHEFRAGVAPVRVTTDVDMLVDVAAPSVSLASTAAAITGLGFVAEVPAEVRKPVYRFVRGAEQIDLMVPDHLPKQVVPRLRSRPAFAVDGGAQALARRDRFRIPTPGGQSSSQRRMCSARSSASPSPTRSTAETPAATSPTVPYSQRR